MVMSFACACQTHITSLPTFPKDNKQQWYNVTAPNRCVVKSVIQDVFFLPIVKFALYLLN